MRVADPVEVVHLRGGLEAVDGGHVGQGPVVEQGGGSQRCGGGRWRWRVPSPGAQRGTDERGEGRCYLDADWFNLSVVVNIFEDRRVEITQSRLPNLALSYELLHCQPEL